MSWLRHDDAEVLDRRVGELTDPEYRGRHALMQLCAREYREHGVFPPSDIVHAVWASPKGPRSLTAKMLARLRELGMVRDRGSYTDDEIAMLGLEDAWVEGDDRLRIHNWERYNPPRDITNLDQRVQLFLQAHPDATANDVCRAIPGQRKTVLAAIKRTKDGGSSTGTRTGSSTSGQPGGEVVPEPGASGSQGGSRTGSRAGTRVRSRPVPSRKEPQAVALDATDPERDRTALDFIDTLELREMP